ncbi:MAG: hypothetical protein GXO80_07820 [Chlorobi bacterium]|nr:hypothetical protein [Chlorobiota bacterium]
MIFQFLKNVIEYVRGQEQLIKKLKSLSEEDGVIYFGYPPWQNPFGGHRQVANHKILSDKSEFQKIHNL